MAKRDPSTLRSTKAKPDPDKVEAPLEVTHPEHSAQVPASEAEALQPAPETGDRPVNQESQDKAAGEATLADAGKSEPGKATAPPTTSPAELEEQLISDLEALSDYLKKSGVSLLPLPAKENMERFWLPDARGGHFGLVMCMMAGTGNPRESFQGPKPAWMQLLYERGYMVQVVFGVGQARDLIERYRQFEETPTPFRAR